MLIYVVVHGAAPLGVQVELPARTVIHACVAIILGVLVSGSASSVGFSTSGRRSQVLASAY